MSEAGNNNGGGRVLDVDTPDFCMSCGLKTKEWITEHPEAKWIRVDIMPGIALFSCPQCNGACFNSNVQENNRQVMAWQREDAERKIVEASNLIDPRTNKVVDLKRA